MLVDIKEGLIVNVLDLIDPQLQFSSSKIEEE
jgi:hypothetical protein